MSCLALKAEGCGSRRSGTIDLRKLDLNIVHVGRWAGRYILVDRGLLFIPGNAHAGAFGEDEVELGAKNACSTGGGSLAKLLKRCPLFSYDHLDDKVVLDAHAALAIHVAEWLESNVARGVELDVDFAALEVSLPASLDFLRCDRTDILMKNTLALTTDLSNVLCACRRNELLSLLDAPIELPKPPASL